ncbi:hypothetical protein QR680_018715 [Steinernema hermaphroditum]|uniref:PCI domain-containing protein n=1 Tax=Steinernema hermaphroditum TaxID=289476 RepID=A0AA39HL31_9BILA|nr:hypothetical protein QR680_018715 [Steinernema hermaphroditum]
MFPTCYCIIYVAANNATSSFKAARNSISSTGSSRMTEAAFTEKSDQVFDERARTLISMCAERDIVPLKDIAQRLGLTVGEELEDLIMKVIMANGIKAKIDEHAGNLHVYWYFQLTFGDEQWKLLSRSIDVLLGRLAKSSEYVQDCIKQRHQPWQESDQYNGTDDDVNAEEDFNEEDEDAEEVSQD